MVARIGGNHSTAYLATRLLCRDVELVFTHINTILYSVAAVTIEHSCLIPKVGVRNDQYFKCVVTADTDLKS